MVEVYRAIRASDDYANIPTLRENFGKQSSRWPWYRHHVGLSWALSALTR